MEQPLRGEEKQFLWVNKDEASLSLSKSDRSESKRIFQFVQHQRPDISSKTKDGQPNGRSPAVRVPARTSPQAMQRRFRLPQLLSVR